MVHQDMKRKWLNLELLIIMRVLKWKCLWEIEDNSNNNNNNKCRIQKRKLLIHMPCCLVFFGVGIMGDLVVFSRLFLKVKYVVYSNYLTNNVTWFRYRLFRNLFELSAIKGKAIVPWDLFFWKDSNAKSIHPSQHGSYLLSFTDTFFLRTKSILESC
jgi:predicted membrane protein